MPWQILSLAVPRRPCRRVSSRAHTAVAQEYVSKLKVHETHWLKMFKHLESSVTHLEPSAVVARYESEQNGTSHAAENRNKDGCGAFKGIHSCARLDHAPKY